MSETEICLDLVPLGTDPSGEWCGTCLLPSGVTVRVALANSSTLKLVATWAATFCTECAQPITTEGEQP